MKRPDRARLQRRAAIRRPLAFASLMIALSGCGLTGREARSPGDSPRNTTGIELTEGTALYFDISPVDGAIVIDLLGQLWEMPNGGGTTRALTDAIRDIADDRQPAVSPDGQWIATRSDRSEGRGIWVHSRNGQVHRQLTDSALVLGDNVGLPVWLPNARELLYVRSGTIRHIDLASRSSRTLAFDSLNNVSLDEPALSTDGSRLLVTGPWPGGSARALLDGVAGTAIWEIDLAARRAKRLTQSGVAARAPAYAPDGERIAYFVSDSAGVRLVVRNIDGTTRVVAAEPNIEPRRVRWSADGQELLYVAAGRLRRVPAAAGESRAVPFTARLDLPRPTRTRAPLRVAEPGSRMTARGFSGLALAPDGAQIALLALGKLWLIDLDGRARAAAEVPVTAIALAWAPDSRQVVWGDGVEGEQDVWVTDIASGVSRRVTNLRGVEWPLGWSPSGKWIAFTHTDSIRLVRAPGASAADSVLNLGLLRFSEIAALGSPWAWLPGDTLLVYGMNQWPVASRTCTEAELVPVSGNRVQVAQFPCRPGHPATAADGSLLAIESGLLVRHARTADGWGVGEPLTERAALYPTAATDGSLLYVGPDGLHLRARNNRERTLGWPITFQSPRAPALLLRDVRIVALEDTDVTPRDVLIVDGRIRAIGAVGSLALPAGDDARILDAQGKWLLPGLIDTHLHFIDTDIAVPRSALEQGITTMREMWSALGVATAFRDAIDAGVVAGARIVVSGPPVYPSPTGVPITTDFLWVPTSPAEVDRGLALLAGFGAGHVKMRYVQTWFGGAQFVQRANAYGLRVSGHCVHGLALVLAGVAGHEHADGQCGEWEFGMRDDIAQLYAHAGVAVAPIIDLHAETARRSEQMPAEGRARLQRRTDRAREHTRLLQAAGATIVTGSDAQSFPGGVHRELQQLVQAGLSNRDALLAATRQAADALGLRGVTGEVKTGYLADLLLLDADPLADISNTRRIWKVIQAGRIVQ